MTVPLAAFSGRLRPDEDLMERGPATTWLAGLLPFPGRSIVYVCEDCLTEWKSHLAYLECCSPLNDPSDLDN